MGEAGIGEFTGTVGPLEPPFVKREEDDEGVDTGGGTAVHPRCFRRKIESGFSPGVGPPRGPNRRAQFPRDGSNASKFVGDRGEVNGLSVVGWGRAVLTPLISAFVS